MNPSPFHATPVKDGRRILGEKSANACLSPAGNRTVDLTPVKRTSLFESNSSPKKLLPSPEFMSRKRPIAQVDGIPSNYESSPVQRVSAMPHGTTTSTQSTIADDSQVSLSDVQGFEYS